MIKAPGIPTRYRLRVKQRLRVLEFTRQIGVRAANRRFGISRNIVREWKRRFEAEGVLGLVPRYPATRKSPMPAEIVELLRYARTELEYGAAGREAGGGPFRVSPAVLPRWWRCRSSSSASSLRRRALPRRHPPQARRRARGVICQEMPQRSLHQPHWLSLPSLPTIAFQ